MSPTGSPIAKRASNKIVLSFTPTSPFYYSVTFPTTPPNDPIQCFIWDFFFQLVLFLFKFYNSFLYYTFFFFHPSGHRYIVLISIPYSSTSLLLPFRLSFSRDLHYLDSKRTSTLNLFLFSPFKNNDMILAMRCPK